MATATLDTSAITDWDSFHAASKAAFGFPDGGNITAWIDCLTGLDDGMSRFNRPKDETLTIAVRGAHAFAERCPISRSR